MKLVPDGWRWPRLVTHVLDSESTTVTLGYWVFIIASLAAFVVKLLTPDSWLWCVVLASILVGGKLVTKSILEAMSLKLGKAPEPEKETPPNGPTPVPAPPPNA